MQRFFVTFRNDARLQWRNGFGYAILFVTLLWVLAATRLPAAQLNWLLPLMVVNNLLITAFYFMAALVLLERDEGSLAALAVTPLLAGEYLAGKVTALTMLALVQNLALGLVFGVRESSIVLLAAGVLLGTILLTLFGFALVSRYSSINTFLVPSFVYSAVLIAPILPLGLGWDFWPIYMHPLQAPLVLLQAAVAPVPPWQIAYGLLYSTLWIFLTGRWACRVYERGDR